MPAKLDISKPLRLIGIQIFKDTPKSVRKSLDPGWYPFIKCDNSDGIGTAKDKYPHVSKEGCPQDYYTIDENLPRISVSAIAGKNGSGKSTLIDALYRIINNFAENTFLMKGVDETDEIGHAFGIYGRLHFEQDGVQKFIECNDLGTFYYEVVNGQPEEIKIHGLTERQRDAILNGFFYTISVNYSLYAFNPADYSSPFEQNEVKLNDGDWLTYLFHKNDGYYIPIVLTPFREKGQIDVNNENGLAKQRIEVLSLLFHSQEKEFLEEYVPSKFKYRYINDYWEKKSMSFMEKPVRSELNGVEDILIFNLEHIWEDLLEEQLHRQFKSDDSDRDKNSLFYLAYKTLKICATYPKYREASKMNGLLDMKEPVLSEKTGKPLTNDDGSEVLRVSSTSVAVWFNTNNDTLRQVVKDIYESPCNHITLKVHQCLDYLKENRFADDENDLDVDKELLNGNRYETYDEMMRKLPPPFFMTEVTYKRKGRKGSEDNEGEVTLQSMSSGERQMLYSLSYIYYHIKNIASIKGEDGKRVVGYHHINLIFDEAELYYHPEYQRQYVKRLLERLALCHINRTNIRSINIIIITHSPFILSDLPDTNILFLHKGDEEEEEVPQKTLGANIYELLKSGFFLDYAIGDMVQQKLQDIMMVYYEEDEKKQREAFLKRKDEFKFTIEHLGEEYLQRNFIHVYEELEQKVLGTDRRTQLAMKMEWLQKEMAAIKAQLKEE